MIITVLTADALGFIDISHWSDRRISHRLKANSGENVEEVL